MSSGALHRNMYRRFNAKDTRSPSYETNHRGRKDRWPLEKLSDKYIYYRGQYMKYQDVKLEKRLMPEDDPLSPEFNKRMLMGTFGPDESKTFYENLRQKYIFDLRKITLEEITKLKRRFMEETGEEL